jgi:hypothetical protein
MPSIKGEVFVNIYPAEEISAKNEFEGSRIRYNRWG